MHFESFCFNACRMPFTRVKRKESMNIFLQGTFFFPFNLYDNIHSTTPRQCWISNRRQQSLLQHLIYWKFYTLTSQAISWTLPKENCVRLAISPLCEWNNYLVAGIVKDTLSISTFGLGFYFPTISLGILGYRLRNSFYVFFFFKVYIHVLPCPYLFCFYLLDPNTVSLLETKEPINNGAKMANMRTENNEMY